MKYYTMKQGMWVIIAVVGGDNLGWVAYNFGVVEIISEFGILKYGANLRK